MEPLKHIGFLMHWDFFVPSTEGYVEPPRLGLERIKVTKMLSIHDPYEGIEDQKTCHGISSGFAAWFYQLNNTPQRAPSYVCYQLDVAYGHGSTVLDISDPNDQARLAYLAPAAKHYGFDILIAHLELYVESTWGWDHDYKDYEAVCDLNGDDYDLTSGELSLEPTWKVTNLDGTHTSRGEAALEQVVEAMEMDEGLGIINYTVYLQTDENMEFECVDMGIYTDTLQVSCTKEASFLLILPKDS